MNIEVGKIYRGPVGRIEILELNGMDCVYKGLEGRYVGMIGEVDIGCLIADEKPDINSSEAPDPITLTITYPDGVGVLEGEFEASNGELFKCKIERVF